MAIILALIIYSIQYNMMLNGTAEGINITNLTFKLNAHIVLTQSGLQYEFLKKITHLNCSYKPSCATIPTEVWQSLSEMQSEASLTDEAFPTDFNGSSVIHALFTYMA